MAFHSNARVARFKQIVETDRTSDFPASDGSWQFKHLSRHSMADFQEEWRHLCLQQLSWRTTLSVLQKGE